MYTGEISFYPKYSSSMQRNIARLTTVRIKGDTHDRWTGTVGSAKQKFRWQTSIRAAGASPRTLCPVARSWNVLGLPKILDFRKLHAPTPPSFSAFSLFADNYPSDAIGATSRIRLPVFFFFFSIEFPCSIFVRDADHSTHPKEAEECISWQTRTCLWQLKLLNCV